MGTNDGFASIVLVLVLVLFRFAVQAGALKLSEPLGSSVLGDPGMKSKNVRVAVEGWNFCNRVGIEWPGSPSPRWADCTDITCDCNASMLDTCRASYRVVETDNRLQTGQVFPLGSFQASNDADLYAVEKEKYLASLCADNSSTKSWHFWMIMLKNGNFDEISGLCKSFALKPMTNNSNPRQMSQLSAFPCFGPGCMNQPVVYHNWSSLSNSNARKDETSSVGLDDSLAGSFYGTYDVDQTGAPSNLSGNASYFSVEWEKNKTSGSWIFTHKLAVSEKYPWLMLYLRADATHGVSGGYPWETRGMMRQVPVSPNFKVVVTLNVISGGGPASQFYLIDIGGCWKNNGGTCDGDVNTDVTRYVEMIINPQTSAWCRPESLSLCPPYHVLKNGTAIARTNTKNFPYSAYHLYCSPPNALHPEKPYGICDPYSNPQAQELVQLLPHPEWAVHGYPEKKGDGWVGDPRSWILDVGALSNRLYFYQDPETQPATRAWPSIDVGTEIYNGQGSIMASWIDPGTEPATRAWPSIDVGTEVYVSSQPYTAVWTVSDFDVLVPTDSKDVSTLSYQTY